MAIVLPFHMGTSSNIGGLAVFGVKSDVWSGRKGRCLWRHYLRFRKGPRVWRGRVVGLFHRLVVVARFARSRREFRLV